VQLKKIQKYFKFGS